jgi:hypothetical protein
MRNRVWELAGRRRVGEAPYVDRIGICLWARCGWCSFDTRFGEFGQFGQFWEFVFLRVGKIVVVVVVVVVKAFIVRVRNYAQFPPFLGHIFV